MKPFWMLGALGVTAIDASAVVTVAVVLPDIGAIVAVNVTDP